MSDTPRTDEREARSEGLHDEWAFALCRQLERELAEARDRQWANAIHSCHNECARPMCVLRRERDEWKEKAEVILRALAATQDVIGCDCGGGYGLCDQCLKADTKADELIKTWETNQPKP
jgi:hypothetical protein